MDLLPLAAKHGGAKSSGGWRDVATGRVAFNFLRRIDVAQYPEQYLPAREVGRCHDHSRLCCNWSVNRRDAVGRGKAVCQNQIMGAVLRAILADGCPRASCLDQKCFNSFSQLYS